MDRNDIGMGGEPKTTVSNGEKHLVIKKYANRKYYNTEESHYLTIVDIQNAVKSGRSVVVIDNVSKKDITAKTLLMSIVETEGERDDLLLTDVVALIKNGLSKR